LRPYYFNNALRCDLLPLRATVQASVELAQSRQLSNRIRRYPSPSGQTRPAHHFGTRRKRKSATPLPPGFGALSSSPLTTAKPVPSECRLGCRLEWMTLTCCFRSSCKRFRTCGSGACPTGLRRHMMRRFNISRRCLMESVVSLFTTRSYSGCPRSTHFGSGVHRPQREGSGGRHIGLPPRPMGPPDRLGDRGMCVWRKGGSPQKSGDACHPVVASVVVCR